MEMATRKEMVRGERNRRIEVLRHRRGQVISLKKTWIVMGMGMLKLLIVLKLKGSRC